MWRLNQAVTSVKWLEDEVELIALYSTKNKHGRRNERSSAVQRDLLSAAIGGWLGVASLSNLSGYLVCCLLYVVQDLLTVMGWMHFLM